MTKNSIKDEWAWLANVTGPLDEDFVAAALEKPDEQTRPDDVVPEHHGGPRKAAQKHIAGKTK